VGVYLEIKKLFCILDKNIIMESNKDICKLVINLLNEDGFFENEWIDEHKFRPRFYKATEHIEFKRTEETINRFIGMAEVVSREIVKENINTTLDELQTKGLVNEVTTENGNSGFVLNKNFKNE
tara:strand:+ start:16 stop:387 length:372 start_codon:yes stop_codon:yes gene_type:complete